MRRALHATRSVPCRSHRHHSQHLQPKRSAHVYTQGEGFLGCLGHGDLIAREKAVPVAALAGMDARCVSAGWSHSAAVCGDGKLLVWGRPYDIKQPMRINRLQLIFPSLVAKLSKYSDKQELMRTPVPLTMCSTTQPEASPLFDDVRPVPPDVLEAPGGWFDATKSYYDASNDPASSDEADSTPSTSTAALPPQVKAKTVSCSAALTVVIGDDSQVYCMGYNAWGQCGQGPGNVFTIFIPTLVGGEAMQGEKATQLALGFQHALVLCESGVVYGWGKGKRGQLGMGAEIVEIPTPVELPGKAVDLRSGFNHAVAVLENGDVYLWGRSQSSELKRNGRVPVYKDQLYPRKVDLGGARATEAFCSSYNTILRMEDGRMMMFGFEVDTKRMTTVPVEVDIPASKPGSFFSGFNETIIRTERDSLTALFKLSFTSKGAIVVPYTVPGIGMDRDVSSISVGWKHVAAIVE